MRRGGAGKRASYPQAPGDPVKLLTLLLLILTWFAVWGV